MLRDTFAGTNDGRLGRWRFALCALTLLVHTLIGALAVAAALAIAAVFALPEPVDRFLRAGVFKGVMIALALSFLYGLLNLLAKRARDLGLPGWAAALGAASAFAASALALPVSAVPMVIVTALAGLTFVLLPSGRFAPPRGAGAPSDDPALDPS